MRLGLIIAVGILSVADSETHIPEEIQEAINTTTVIPPTFHSDSPLPESLLLETTMTPKTIPPSITPFPPSAGKTTLPKTAVTSQQPAISLQSLTTRAPTTLPPATTLPPPETTISTEHRSTLFKKNSSHYNNRRIKSVRLPPFLNRQYFRKSPTIGELCNENGRFSVSRSNDCSGKKKINYIYMLPIDLQDSKASISEGTSKPVNSRRSGVPGILKRIIPIPPHSKFLPPIKFQKKDSAPDSLPKIFPKKDFPLFTK